MLERLPQQPIEVVQPVPCRLALGDRAEDSRQHLTRLERPSVDGLRLSRLRGGLTPQRNRNLGRKDPCPLGPLSQPIEVGQPFLLRPATGPVHRVHQVESGIPTDVLEGKILSDY